MKLSLVITAYNYAQYLPEAIESALKQTYENKEIIVVNDGSTDNTDEIILPFLDKIKYIKQNNRGLPSARNTGIMNATGEYILFLDADDLIAPLYLEDAIVLAEKEKADVIYCDLQHFGDRDDKVKMADNLTKEMFVSFNPLSYCSLIKKSCLLECGGYNVKMKFGWEDYECWIELFLRGKKFIHLPFSYFMYRRHGASMIDTSFKPEAVEYSTKLLKEIHPKLYI